MDFAVQGVATDHGVAFMRFALFRLEGSFERVCGAGDDGVTYIYGDYGEAAIAEDGEDSLCVFGDVDFRGLCCGWHLGLGEDWVWWQIASTAFI